MTEEFAESITELNKKPVNEQLEEFKQIVSKLVDLTVKLIDNCSMEFSNIKNKIISLETKKMNIKLPKIKTLSVLPSPPLPQQRPIGDENLRITILGEIKELFEKKE